MTTHSFGGNWTEEKLRRVEMYLPAYMQIFAKNKFAQRYVTTYVDAFAGTGSRGTRGNDGTDTLALFDLQDQADIQQFYRGSTRIALEIETPFDQYLFIEQNPNFITELQRLKEQFPALASRIDIHQGEANVVLQEWCQNTDWENNRAVVFLDPYGMSVNWTTIQAIARTEGIDLWVLLPVGSAINRMLPRQGPPTGAWAYSLSRIFGTDEWITSFYRPRVQTSFFDELNDSLEKDASFTKIGEFFVERLKTEFAGVSEQFSMFFNSKRNPIFMLFFAAGNRRGAPTAIRIASHILRR